MKVSALINQCISASFIILVFLDSCMRPKISSGSLPGIKNSDTVLVGKLLASDSIYTKLNSTYIGYKFYYGVHHLKIGVLDVISKEIKDTIIISYVYNMFNENSLYLKNFNLSLFKNYIFYLHEYTPCKSDFPKIQGSCEVNGFFEPESNSLIKKYKNIYRIINIIECRP